MNLAERPFEKRCITVDDFGTKKKVITLDALELILDEALKEQRELDIIKAHRELKEKLQEQREACAEKFKSTSNQLGCGYYQSQVIAILNAKVSE